MHPTAFDLLGKHFRYYSRVSTIAAETFMNHAG